ncbi:MAG: phage capsid protein, partial [Rhodospirillaceae bacterium]|nr:phage capsid protein [Rhodospirillaceae bacterium]
AYQGMGLLRGTVRFRSGVIGSTHRFPKMGKGTATRRVPQTRVVPMNISHTKATATIEDWNAPEFTDIFDQQKVNYDERAELAEVIAGAIGRREDQLILDALDAASTTLTISTDIGGTGSGLNTAKCRRARRLLSTQGVPKSGGRTLVIHSIGMEQLLGDSDANTVDKNTIKALVDGEISHWLGFDIIEMEDRDEGGLPLASSVRTNYAYHQTAVGLAMGIDFRTEVNYIPDMTSWLANGIFAAGSVGIDALGIVEMSTTES